MTNSRELGFYLFEELSLNPKINLNNLHNFIIFINFNNFINIQTFKINQTPKASRLSKNYLKSTWRTTSRTTSWTTLTITSRPLNLTQPGPTGLKFCLNLYFPPKNWHTLKIFSCNHIWTTTKLWTWHF